MPGSVAPLLFAQDDPDGAEAQRSSIVAPAQRSSQTKGKEQRKHNAEGFPVQSFGELLSDLATLTRNSIEPADAPGCHFTQHSEPTPLQRRAFELLGVNP